jgi:alanyl-tRNA synthetase
LRAAFLDFFARRGHTVVPSSALVPARDPTLLFSNAGMNQFKDVFLGVETRSYTRAASSQKCMRVSGKHNDLEQVGYTPRHHTFFEMLGNFSFGDYFKKEAIQSAWELLSGPPSSGCFGLDPGRLQVTVFRDDDDAFGFWRKDVGVPKERISRLGEKDNFWQMGDTGPCGPCSEIHYDRGKDKREGECSQPGCGPGCECGRFMELWNLVFIQYDRQPDGALAPLKRTGVDTGMGLERIASVLQNVDSNFDTDLFRPILERILELANERGEFKKKRLEELNLDERRWVQVIADHVRAMTFLMSEGVTPSNERRGYVLRLIVRRALRHGRHLGIERPFLCDLSGTVIDGMAAPWIDERGEEHESPYHDLVAHREAIARMARREEERFAATVAVSVRMAEEKAQEWSRAGRKEFPGEEAFRLYDTFGLPLDMIRDVARDYRLNLDEGVFERALAEQRERSRRGIKESAGATVSGALARLPEKRVEFLGYELTRVEGARIVAILRGEALVDELSAGEEAQVLLDRTPFYAEAGGQVGDTGFLTAAGGVGEVLDTQAPLPRLNLHKVAVREGRLRAGDAILAEVDQARREAIRRSHTATHLAHAALRDIVGTHVKQAGSLVNPDRFRFDFSHYAALTPEIVRQVEDEVNDVIRQDLPIRVNVLPLDEALRRGALAFFGDKYGEQVRVVEVPGFSMELCGGTHTPSTGVIGLFKVIQERGTAAGVRRIETLSGEQALRQFQGQQSVLQDLGSALGVEPAGLTESVRRLQQSAKALQREVESLRLKLAEGAGSTAQEPVLEVRGLKVLVKKVSGLDRAGMRSLTDRLKQKLGSGVVVLGQVEGEEASLLVAVTRDLASRVSAGAIIRQLAPIVGGRGGGRDELAEAGGKQGGQLDQALAEVGPAIEKVVGA